MGMSKCSYFGLTEGCNRHWRHLMICVPEQILFGLLDQEE